MQVVGDMLRYPNQMSFDLMENGGALPPPQGMLVIRVVGIKKLHGVGHWWDKVTPAPSYLLQKAAAAAAAAAGVLSRPARCQQHRFSILLRRDRAQLTQGANGQVGYIRGSLPCTWDAQHLAAPCRLTPT